MSTAPWKFYDVHWNARNVVVDDEGRHLASHVPTVDGPLLAAGPDLLRALQRIAAIAREDSPERRIAADAIRGYTYPEAQRPCPIPNLAVPRLDDSERDVVLVLLRRLVTWCARKGDVSRMESYAQLWCDVDGARHSHAVTQ